MEVTTILTRGGCGLPLRLTASAPQTALFRGSMAGLHFPLSTLRWRPRGRHRMTRGQGGSLYLSCIELSSTTLCQSPGALSVPPTPLFHLEASGESTLPDSPITSTTWRRLAVGDSRIQGKDKGSRWFSARRHMQQFNWARRQRMAYCLGNRELNSPYMSLETSYERIRRIVQMIGTGDVSPLAFALWLRWHRLEFGYADDVAASDGNSHQHSGGPALAKAVRTLPVPDGAVALDLGAGMGIAALTLSRHFSRVVGVELAPALIAAAQRNLGRLNVVNVELHCVTLSLESVPHSRVTN